MDIDIDYIARLAKLNLTAEERDLFKGQFPAIIDYIARLQEVDTSKVDAKAYLTDATNVFRADEPSTAPGLRDAVVKAFPKQKGDALEVPGVFNDK